MKVNHILLGAGRSGTTTIFEYLKLHPQINESSIKEVTYFSEDDKYTRGAPYLHSFFSDNQGHINATSDTYLLMSKQAPQRIYNYNPDCKLAVILREPSERSFSAYHYALNHNYIPKETTFLQMISYEKQAKNADIIQQNNLAVFEGSLYYKHLKHWLTYFKREQLFICTTDQLKSDHQTLMSNYFEFLNIDNFLLGDELKMNTSKTIKHKGVNEVLMNRNHPLRKIVRPLLQQEYIRQALIKSGWIERLKEQNQKQQTKYTELSVEERQYCHQYFKEDKRLLKQEFGVDFTDDGYV